MDNNNGQLEGSSDAEVLARRCITVNKPLQAWAVAVLLERLRAARGEEGER